MRKTATIVVVLLFGPPAGAQPPVEPPAAGQPREFSHVVGRFRLNAAAAPTEVAVEEPITLTVTIQAQGKVHPQQAPRRETLKIFPKDFERDFYVEPVPEQDRTTPDSWEFVYRLRPKRTSVAAIDGLKLYYYSPAPKGYQVARAETISITVKPRPQPPVVLPKDVLPTVPAAFRELADSRAVLTPWHAEFAPRAWLVALVLLAPPILALASVRCWRKLRPGADVVSQRFRSAAGRRAIAKLAADDESPWLVLGDYVQDRFDFAAAEPTPAEVEKLLRRRGASKALARRFAEVLAACDAIRFTGQPVGAGELRHEAASMIDALEADLCAP